MNQILKLILILSIINLSVHGQNMVDETIPECSLNRHALMVKTLKYNLELDSSLIDEEIETIWFNDKEQVIKSQYQYFEEDTIDYKCLYRYNPTGLITSKYYLKENDTTILVDFKYEDNKLKMIKFIDLQNNEVLFELIYTVYKDSTIIVESPNSSPFPGIIKKFYQNDTLIKEEQIVDNELISYAIYNPNGDMIEHMVIGKTTTFKYEYKENGLIQKKLAIRLELIQNELNYQYEFDTEGNWIKMICCNNDGYCSIADRVIEYKK